MYKKNLEYGVFYVKNITIIMTLKKRNRECFRNLNI